jgi:hypothetical protein
VVKRRLAKRYVRGAQRARACPRAPRLISPRSQRVPAPCGVDLRVQGLPLVLLTSAAGAVDGGLEVMLSARERYAVVLLPSQPASQPASQAGRRHGCANRAMSVAARCALAGRFARVVFELVYPRSLGRGDRAANGRSFDEAWWQGGVRERAARTRPVDRHARPSRGRCVPVPLDISLNEQRRRSVGKRAWG